MQSVYDRYGGFASVHRVVMAFYERVLDDDDLGPFFDDTEMTRLIDHQTQFVASLLGGPATIADARLKAAHAPLGITDPQFDRIGTLLSETLADHGFAPEDVALVMAEVEARRGLVVA